MTQRDGARQRARSAAPAADSAKSPPPSKTTDLHELPPAATIAEMFARRLATGAPEGLHRLRKLILENETAILEALAPANLAELEARADLACMMIRARAVKAWAASVPEYQSQPSNHPIRALVRAFEQICARRKAEG